MMNHTYQVTDSNQFAPAAVRSDLTEHVFCTVSQFTYIYKKKKSSLDTRFDLSSLVISVIKLQLADFRAQSTIFF